MARRKWDYGTIQQVLDNQNPFVQSGYSKAPIVRKKGELWTDSQGRTWLQKDGCRVRVNKQVDKIREQLKEKCSKCSAEIRWGDAYDKKMFTKTGMCYTCLIDLETEKRANGTFDLYEQKKVLNNQLSVAKEFKDRLKEAISYLENYDGKIEIYHEETGMQETWTDDTVKERLVEAKTDTDICINKINELSEAIQEVDKKEKERLNEYAGSAQS